MLYPIVQANHPLTEEGLLESFSSFAARSFLTEKDFSLFLNKEVTTEEIEDYFNSNSGIVEATVTNVLLINWGIGALPEDSIRLLVLDTVLQYRSPEPIKWLQEMVEEKTDGWVGAKTLEGYFSYEDSGDEWSKDAQALFSMFLSKVSFIMPDSNLTSEISYRSDTYSFD